MNITQNKVDDLNATMKVVIEKSDYAEKVEKALKDYRKNANISGFRKGMVPMTLIKKQYEKPLIYEEVNKLLQSEIDKYFLDNKIEILGQPIPVEDNNFDWDAETLEFNFELGLAPTFDLNLKDLEIPYHKIEVSEEEVDKYIENFRRQYGKMQEGEEVKDSSYLKGVFYELNEKGEEEGSHYHANVSVSDLKDVDGFVGKKKDEKIEVNPHELFKDELQMQEIFGLEDNEVASFTDKLSFKINQITNHELAEIDKDLFAKVYGDEPIETEEDFRSKVKAEAEKMYVGEADRVMLTAGLMELVEKNKFDLPKDFLIKWLKFSRKEPITDEQATEMYEKSEKGIRFQLVEGKVASEYKLSVTPEEVMTKALDAVKQQLKAYGGGMNFEEEQIKQIAQSALQNQEEYQRLADQVFAEKMMTIFKENAKLNEKVVSFDDFVEDVKKQNEKNQPKENVNNDESK